MEWKNWKHVHLYFCTQHTFIANLFIPGMLNFAHMYEAIDVTAVPAVATNVCSTKAYSGEGFTSATLAENAELSHQGEASTLSLSI